MLSTLVCETCFCVVHNLILEAFFVRILLYLFSFSYLDVTFRPVVKKELQRFLSCFRGRHSALLGGAHCFIAYPSMMRSLKSPFKLLVRCYQSFRRGTQKHLLHTWMFFKRLLLVPFTIFSAFKLFLFVCIFPQTRWYYKVGLLGNLLPVALWAVAKLLFLSRGLKMLLFLKNKTYLLYLWLNIKFLCRTCSFFFFLNIIHKNYNITHLARVGHNPKHIFCIFGLLLI